MKKPFIIVTEASQFELIKKLIDHNKYDLKLIYNYPLCYGYDYENREVIIFSPHHMKLMSTYNAIKEYVINHNGILKVMYFSHFYENQETRKMFL